MRPLHEDLPWNLEGLFAEAAFRSLAMRFPRAAKWFARFDDRLGRGSINPVKKWWWDIELNPKTMQYVRAQHVHARGLNMQLDLEYEDQTLAVYPADVMPPPYPVVHPLDREAGIARYRSLLTPGQYRARLDEGRTEGLAPPFRMPEGPPPVFPVVLRKRVDMTPDIARYQFASPDGAELPPFAAGAHVDVVIAPEYQRQYSLAGDPADRASYVLGVLREPEGRGGSALMHRSFREGRRVFISAPHNQFPLEETAAKVFLFAGGIGVTPMLAMAHRLHALKRDFELHYSARSPETAGFVDDLAQAPWRERVTLHFTDRGTRADLERLMPRYRPGFHLYVCGSARYMDAVYAAAAAKGWPDDALHKEYFSAPKAPERVNHSFTLRLAKSGRTVEVPPEMSATEALREVGIVIDTKCSDGICGVCAVPYLSGRSNTATSC
ncbi:MAG: PDR/VanB family oxidoreductase [Xanthobacteraceae bacterium]